MDTIRTARAGAVICIVGAAAAVGFSLAELVGFGPADDSPYLVAIYVATLAGVAALALTGAAAGATGKAGVGIAVAGLLGFVVAALTAPGPTSDTLFAVVPLVTAAGMVLVGVAVLRSGRWSGWHRYTPLIVGAWIVVVVVPVIALTGDPDASASALAAIGAWHLLWVALGVAVLAETRSAVRVPA
jgi:hypothetical protein